MKTIEQARKTRKESRVLGKFHIAHFPVGTVVEVERVTAGYIPEEERVNEYERYKRSIVTVAGVVQNGPNSWCLELTTKCGLDGELDGVNIHWVRRIIKRGDGKLYGEDKRVVEEVRAARKEYLSSVPYNRYDVAVYPSFCKGTYCTYSIRELVRERMDQMRHDPAHLIDIDVLTRKIYAILKPNTNDTFLFVVNKKKFIKAFNRAYSTSKVSRKKYEADEAKLEMERWEKEMQHEFAND